MSRLDYFTIAVVAACILAIVFLLYKTSDLIGGKKETQSELQKTLKDMGIDEETIDATTVSDSTATKTDAGEAKTDNAPQTAAGKSTTPKTTPVKEEVDYSKKTETAKPETTAKTPKSAPAKPASAVTASSASGGFLVVAGSFKVKENAEKEAKRLIKLGYSNASVETFNKGALATLVVDKFDSEKDAVKLVEELKAKNIPAYVHRKRD